MAHRFVRPGQRTLYSHRPFTDDDTTGTPTGTIGASLYYTSAASGTLPDAITFRENRLIEPQKRVLALGNAWGPKTARKATVTAPDNDFTFAATSGQAYRVQVRTWKDDRENLAIYREQIYDVDAAPIISGTGYFVRAELRENGGVRFQWVWNRNTQNDDPASFTLTRTAGPTSPSDVSVTYQAKKRFYETTLTGLSSGAYTFRIKAVNGATEDFLYNGTPGTFDINVTPDATGPPIVTGTGYVER